MIISIDIVSIIILCVFKVKVKIQWKKNKIK